jgi:penicillin-binding protein 2
VERDFNLEKRKYVIGGAVVTIVILYLIRLFTLQIMSEDYKRNADSNAFLNKTQYPSRGVIYDRNGNLLVYNQPAYDVTMVMKEVKNLDTLDPNGSAAASARYGTAAPIPAIRPTPTRCS